MSDFLREQKIEEKIQRKAEYNYRIIAIIAYWAKTRKRDYGKLTTTTKVMFKREVNKINNNKTETTQRNNEAQEYIT